MSGLIYSFIATFHSSPNCSNFISTFPQNSLALLHFKCHRFKFWSFTWTKLRDFFKECLPLCMPHSISSSKCHQIYYWKPNPNRFPAGTSSLHLFNAYKIASLHHLALAHVFKTHLILIQPWLSIFVPDLMNFSHNAESLIPCLRTCWYLCLARIFYPSPLFFTQGNFLQMPSSWNLSNHCQQSVMVFLFSHNILFLTTLYCEALKFAISARLWNP